MLYNLIQKRRGKETVMMTDSLTKVNARRKMLLASQRKGIKGEKAIYTIIPTDETDKYKKPSRGESWRAGGYADNPARIKK